MRCLFVSLPYRSITLLAFVTAFFLTILMATFGGTAAAQLVRLNTPQPNVSFPSTAVGSTSTPVTIPLRIYSDGIEISSISVLASQSGAQEYAVQSNGCSLHTPLSTGTICNVIAIFKPVYPGERPVPLQVETSAGNFNFGMEGLGLGPQVALNPATIATVAGNGSKSLSGDGGSAVNAGVVFPLGTALSSGGDFYIADTTDNIIRKVVANTGVISTIAGSPNKPGGISGDQGPAIDAQLNSPTHMAIDSAGNLFIADSGSSFVRKVSATTGIITTVVGTGHYISAPGIPPVSIPPAGYAGDGSFATGAQLNFPESLTFDNADNLYIADSGNHVIRKVDAATQIITTVVGNHKQGYAGDGGPALDAELNSPGGVAIDSQDNIYIADTHNHAIRKVSASSGTIATIAGNGTKGFSGDGGPATNAQLNSPGGISLDSAGNLYIADSSNSRIREVFANSGIIITIAGNGTAAFAGDNGNAANAELSFPNDVSLDSLGNLYIADSLNSRIRQVNVLESELNFATTPIGFSSLDSPQTATVTNTGNAPLLFSVPASGLNPSISPNFILSPSSTCPQLDISSSSEALAPGAFCSLLLSFTPVQTGPISGTANIADNARSIPPFVQTINLNAIGLPASAGRPDFSLSATPSSQTISNSSSATSSAAYVVTVTGIYGFTGDVALSMAGLPSGVNATFSPATVTVTGTSASSTFTVTVSSAQARSAPDKSPFPGEASALQYGLLLLSFPLLGLAGRKRLHRSSRQKTFFTLLVLVILGAAATSMSGCANIGLELQPQSYNITINGTSNNLQRSTALSLTVEQYTQVKYH